MMTRTLTVVIAVACMILAGCSTPPEVPDPPTVTITPPTDPIEPTLTETEEPTPFPTDQLPERLADLVTEPVLPDDANQFTADGAAAFAQFVIDATNWAIASSDASALLEYCAEGSSYCENVRADTEDDQGVESVRHGGYTTIEVTEVDLYVEDHRAFVAGIVRQDPYVDTDWRGVALRQVEAKEFSVALQLLFDEHWWLEAASSE